MTYISGKITGTADYMRRFAEAEAKYTKAGHTVLNPARMSACLPALTHAGYMTICLAALSLCDCIVMLDGWYDSPGAHEERDWADAHGLDVIYDGEAER